MYVYIYMYYMYMFCKRGPSPSRSKAESQYGWPYIADDAPQIMGLGFRVPPLRGAG